MALVFSHFTTKVIDGATVNNGATGASAEQDMGADTVVDGLTAYVSVSGFAATPDGNDRMLLRIVPHHTSAGTDYDDQGWERVISVTADQAYDVATWFPQRIPRYFDVHLENDSGQNTDANGVSVWIEGVKVTA
jgi:hypothetical protein